MGHGGKRPGAGRKRGSLAGKTREIVARATREGVTPLEVMLKAMTVHYNARRYDKAAAVAKDAAPYVHPRLSSVAVAGEMIHHVRRYIGIDPEQV
jgi:hypothetical protein